METPRPSSSTERDRSSDRNRNPSSLGTTTSERIDPSAEEAFWRDNYKNRPYVDANADFYAYAPAYRFGWESWMKEKDNGPFEKVENKLSEAWKKSASATTLAWDKAKHAVRDAWDRVSLDRAEGEGMPPARTSKPERTADQPRDKSDKPY